MEDEAHALDRAIAGRDHSLSGPAAGHLLGDAGVPAAHAGDRGLPPAHPGILVELAIDNRVLSLARREADVALRPVRPREGGLWGRKLSDVAWTAYAAPSYLEGAGCAGPLPGPEALARHALIGWGEEAAGIGAADWLGATAPAEAVVYRSSSLVNQLVAAKAGLGLAILPCYLGDPEPELVRALPEPVPDLARELWIVTHADLRRTARVRAFFDVVGEGIARQRDVLEGRCLAGARTAERLAPREVGPRITRASHPKGRPVAIGRRSERVQTEPRNRGRAFDPCDHRASTSWFSGLHLHDVGAAHHRDAQVHLEQ
jgi:DNA-binding transcriptional LysR family regulator